MFHSNESNMEQIIKLFSNFYFFLQLWSQIDLIIWLYNPD